MIAGTAVVYTWNARAAQLRFLARGKHDTTPAEPGFASRVVDELLRGIGARTASVRQGAPV